MIREMTPADYDEIVGTILCGHDGHRGYIYHGKSFWLKRVWEKKDFLGFYSKSITDKENIPLFEIHRQSLRSLCCIPYHQYDNSQRHQQFCNRHGIPDRICTCQSRQYINQNPTDNHSPCNRNKERGARFH